MQFLMKIKILGGILDFERRRSQRQESFSREGSGLHEVVPVAFLIRDAFIVTPAGF